MALSRGRRYRTGELLARLRRRAVDDAAGHHFSAVGVHAGAVLPVARGDRQGHRARQAQSADRGTDQPAGDGAHPEGRRRGQDLQADRDARRRGARTEAAQDDAAQARRRRRRARQGFRRRRSRSTAKADLRARAGASRRAQPADRRAAQAARGDPGRARRLGDREQGSQAKIADLGQRLNVALAQKVQELRAIAPTSSAACGRSSASGPTSAWSATASCSNPRCCSTPARRTSAGRASSRSTTRRRRARSRARNPARHSLDAAHRRPHRRASDQRRRPVQVELGAFRRARRSRWCNIWSRRASIRTVSPPPASANSSRSTREPTKRPTPATAASS